MITRFGGAHWSAILAEAPDIATLVVESVLALPLNASAMELVVNRDVDLNRELRAAGVANLAASFGGGLVGFHTPSLTGLVERMGGLSRWAGVCSASVCAGALIFGSSVLSLFPRPILAGVVLFLRLGFLLEWTVDAWFRLPRARPHGGALHPDRHRHAGPPRRRRRRDRHGARPVRHRHSRMDVVKHTLSGAMFLSRTERSRPERDLLRELGDRITILELQRFIFFGTAHGLLERIRRRARQLDVALLRFLVLDFRRVTGIDSSAMLSFAKVQRSAARADFELVCAGLPPQVRRQLERIGLRDGDANVRMLSTSTTRWNGARTGC